MSSGKRVRKPGEYILVCVALILVAALLVFLGVQCLTTVEYGLYSQNYSYYVDKAAECRAMADSSYGESYLLIAQNWEESARNAQSYLTWHRAGAISLFIVGALAVCMGIQSAIKGSQLKKKTEAAQPEENKNKKK